MTLPHSIGTKQSENIRVAELISRWCLNFLGAQASVAASVFAGGGGGCITFTLALNLLSVGEINFYIQ